MAPLCSACTILQLPRLADFDGKIKLSRNIRFHCLCTIDGNNTIQPLHQDGELGLLGNTNCGAKEVYFCKECDFCALIFDALSRRYGTEIAEEVQVLRNGNGDGFQKDSPRLRLRLSTLSFQSGGGGYYLVDGKSTKVKDVSLVILEGVLDLFFKVEEMKMTRSMALVLPFEVFANSQGTTADTGLEIYRRQLDPQALSDENMMKIETWLRECVENHPKCALYEQTQHRMSFLTENGKPLFLPTRLIHVGNPCRGKDPKVILPTEEFSNGIVDETQDRYLALSYCWGSVDEREGHLTSDYETIEDRQKAIPWATIPQTFQDLISLAIKLGIHYVWIDSVCILQGEGGDWQEESAKMWSIFANAFLTVISAAGLSSFSGFLNRPTSRSCQVSFPTSSISYSLRHRPGKKWWGTDRMAEISSKTWIGRGWTYQEERLARRALMFGENKFFYDCRTVEQSEDTKVWFPRPSWQEIIYAQPSEPEPGSKSQKEITASRQWKRRIYSHWQWLCTQYSHRKLTFPEDKLPAFSGVAAAVASKIQTRYLAGMWKDNLMHDLFWDTLDEATKPPSYRAPTWSWIALETDRVTWEKHKTCSDGSCQLYCEVLEAETFLTGPNPFGAISGGYLKIKGFILEAKLVLEKPVEDMKNRRWVIAYENHEIAKANLDVLNAAALDDSLAELSAWALLMTTCGKGRATTRGLLLQKVRTRDGFDVFERVGTFSVSASTASDFQLKLSYWMRSDLTACIIE